jgi:hypothetical protein
VLPSLHGCVASCAPAGLHSLCWHRAQQAAGQDLGRSRSAAAKNKPNQQTLLLPRAVQELMQVRQDAGRFRSALIMRAEHWS